MISEAGENKNNEELHIKRGYLKSNFEMFHIKDKRNTEFEYHYHDFNKIIIFISGDVTYIIEGKSYKLKPWDILFINSSEVHKPIINSTETYERFVIWVNSKFIEKHNSSECNLLTCFELAKREKFNVLRVEEEFLIKVKNTLFQLEDAWRSQEFGSELMKNALFVQLIIHLNRLITGEKGSLNLGDVSYDIQIESILAYINENIDDNLAIENISQRFYVSKYYLMHKFKKTTGYTIHSYILHKRLNKASELLRAGATVTEVCSRCGFGDYSSFIRAFKKAYGVSPRKYYTAHIELEKSNSMHL